MNINLGNYLEDVIRASSYTKKDLCTEINNRFKFDGKSINYSTFSNNIRTGDITFNEAIALATIIGDIDLNRVVLTFKNELIKESRLSDNETISKLEVANLLNSNTLSNDIVFKESCILESTKNSYYKGLYVSDDFETAALYDINLQVSGKGLINELAYFTNFNELLLKTRGLVYSDFNNLSLIEKIAILEEEGCNERAVLGMDFTRCVPLLDTL